MKILVIGSGGREHALVWKLARSHHTKHLWCTPGNAGIAQERLSSSGENVECVNISAEDLNGQLAFAKEKQIDLTVVGPDNPLGEGIVDLFQKNGLMIWGPNKQAAQFEASKVFSQEFMQRHNVPTAMSGIFSNSDEAEKFAKKLNWECAVKVDGLALGKGVFICRNQQDTQNAIHTILDEHRFGLAGTRIVIQELLEGMEISLHVLCDGTHWKLFPTSQDHKRAFDNDLGPNTGGMGTYSPTPFLSDTELNSVADKILVPWQNGCLKESIDYKGILYPGIMLTKQGPKVLEFNARFGDPETQVYMPRLKNDLVDLLLASINGTLDQISLEWASQSAVCVIIASGGYPGSYQKGKVIRGLDTVANIKNTKVFHAGTRFNGSTIETSGGRVLGVTAWADTLQEAQTMSYNAVNEIYFEGAFYRKDIASKALK